jgi:hypothetical protein
MKFFRRINLFQHFDNLCVGLVIILFTLSAIVSEAQEFSVPPSSQIAAGDQFDNHRW